MKRPIVLVPLVVVLTALTLVAGVGWGAVHIPVDSILDVLVSRARGVSAPDAVADTIVWGLRLPRVLLAFSVGAGLSIVGVAMQALVRNPLAEPYILGLSSGSAAGAAVYFLGFLPAALTGVVSLPVAAFLGGLGTIAIVYAVARDGSTVPVTRLLLAGVAMSALMGSVTSFITFVSPDPNKLRAVLFWLLGSLSGGTWQILPLPTVVTVLGLVLMMALSRPLDAMLLGEDPARSLGVPVEGIKRLLIVLAALVTGTLVAHSGAIGFVGLIVPHGVRAVVGVSHRRVIPAAFVSGGLFLVWADLLARTLIPDQDLPVGIVTALAGVPFFLVLLRRHRHPFA